MKTQAINQAAIKDFFEAFGPETAKEYSTTIVDVIVLLSKSEDLEKNYREDVVTKLKDLNRLVLQLGVSENFFPPGIMLGIQKN